MEALQRFSPLAVALVSGIVFACIVFHSVEEPFESESEKSDPAIPLLPFLDESVLEGLIITREMKNDLKDALSIEVDIIVPGEDGVENMVYGKYLQEFETAMRGIQKDGSLNILLVLTSSMNIETNVDNSVERVRENLQMAVNHVFSKLFGFGGFPESVDVKIFPVIAKSPQVTLRDSGVFDIVTFESQEDLAELDACNFRTSGVSCSMATGMRAYHYILNYNLYGEVSHEYNAVYSKLHAVSNEANYVRAALSLSGAVPICLRQAKKNV